MTARTMKQLTGRHVLYTLFGFFGVMLIANGIFVYFALTTFNGLESPTAYQDGVDYNARIQAERRQAALGWKHEILLRAEGVLVVSLKDRSGLAVTGLTIRGTLARPASDRFTRDLVFQEAEPGRYKVELEGIQGGNWIAALSATDASANAIYRLKERLWLKPN